MEKDFGLGLAYPFIWVFSLIASVILFPINWILAFASQPAISV